MITINLCIKVQLMGIVDWPNAASEDNWILWVVHLRNSIPVHQIRSPVDGGRPETAALWEVVGRYPLGECRLVPCLDSTRVLETGRAFPHRWRRNDPFHPLLLLQFLLELVLELSHCLSIWSIRWGNHWLPGCRCFAWKAIRHGHRSAVTVGTTDGDPDPRRTGDVRWRLRRHGWPTFTCNSNVIKL